MILLSPLMGASYNRCHTYVNSLRSIDFILCMRSWPSKSKSGTQGSPRLPFRPPRPWQDFNSIILPHNYHMAMRDLEKSSPRTEKMTRRTPYAAVSGESSEMCSDGALRLYKTQLPPCSRPHYDPSVSPSQTHPRQFTETWQPTYPPCRTNFFYVYSRQLHLPTLGTFSNSPMVSIPPPTAKASVSSVVM